MRISDWSSDVCSSDLLGFEGMDALGQGRLRQAQLGGGDAKASFVRQGFCMNEVAQFHIYNQWKSKYVILFIGEILLACLPPTKEVRSNEIGRASCRERVCQYV